MTGPVGRSVATRRRPRPPVPRAASAPSTGPVPDQSIVSSGGAGSPMLNWITAWGSSGIARRSLLPGLAVDERGDLAVNVADLVGAQRLVPLVEEVAQRVDPLGGRLDVDDRRRGVGVQPVEAVAAGGDRARPGSAPSASRGCRCRPAARTAGRPRTPPGGRGCGRRAARPARSEIPSTSPVPVVLAGAIAGPCLERARPRSRSRRRCCWPVDVVADTGAGVGDVGARRARRARRVAARAAAAGGEGQRGQQPAVRRSSRFASRANRSLTRARHGR